MIEGTTCNSTDEAPKSEFVGGAALLLAAGSICPYALAPLTMMLMES
jgi:hypothetical protein